MRCRFQDSARILTFEFELHHSLCRPRTHSLFVPGSLEVRPRLHQAYKHPGRTYVDKVIDSPSCHRRTTIPMIHLSASCANPSALLGSRNTHLFGDTRIVPSFPVCRCTGLVRARMLGDCPHRPSFPVCRCVGARKCQPEHPHPYESLTS